jgi:tellurite resistance protein
MSSPLGQLILILSAAIWLIVVVAYLRNLAHDPMVIGKDLLDPIAAPFASLALITPMLLASVGLYPHAEPAGRAITDVFLVLTVLLGGWFTGQWIYGQVDLDKFHPGHFLPTVAGGLVASASAAAVGQHRLAEFMLGLGLICWIHGADIDGVIALLAGYGTLMVIAQLRLLPTYRRLPFMPSTWAFTFSWAAVASVAFVWLQATHVTGFRVWQYVVLASITVLVAAIAARTLLAVSRGQLLPSPPPAGRVAQVPEPPLPADVLN